MERTFYRYASLILVCGTTVGLAAFMAEDFERTIRVVSLAYLFVFGLREYHRAVSR